MDHNDGFPIASMHLGWADLFITCMMHQMHGWPPFMMNTGFKGTKPWMPQLEDCIRTFLSLPQVQEVVMDLQPKLVRAVRLDDEVAIAAFNLKVSAADCAALVAFVAAQPD